MATQNRVRRKIQYGFDGALEFEQLIETGGIAISNGKCLELVKNDLGTLGFFDSRIEKEFHPRINLDGEEYVPPILAPSVLEALILPSERTDCGLTVEMFGEICDMFLAHGVSKDVAKTSTYFALASWFPEFLPVAPCLAITGTETEARILLQLLSCVVRHALPLAEINLAALDCLPMNVQPSLLIGYVHPSMWRMLSASNHPHTYFPNKKEVRDLYCAKALYAGSTLVGFRGDAILNINCALSGGKLLGSTLDKIAAHFQSKLLDYRLKHFMQVRDSNFDATTLPTPLRMLARALGSCIVDAPELQADIVRLLEGQGEELRATRLLEPHCVAIEAMFLHCHGENGPTRVGVSELANTVTGILADCGETTVFESKEMGSLLRLLGFRTKRDSKGYAIRLTPDVRRLIHRLARDHRVGDSEQAVPGCPDCAELMSEQTGTSNS